MTPFWLVWMIAIVIVLVFGVILLIGAPYVPTLEPQRKQALGLLNLKPGQTLIELGSGDGSVLIEAAKRGWRSVGYELNPFLVLISWVRTRKYRKLVKIKWKNFWQADLSSADGVFVFQLDRYMERIDSMLSAAAKDKKIKLVSHAFKVPGKAPAAKAGGLFLYKY